MASAGRILIMPKGNWDANTEYEMLDLVFAKNTSWLAKKNSVGIEPSVENAEYWFLLCESKNLDEVNQRLAAIENQLLSAITLDDIPEVDLSGYATKSELSGYATKTDLSGYAVKSELSSYATKTDLGSYATKTDLGTVNVNLNGLDGRLDVVEPKVTKLVTDVTSLANTLSGVSGAKFYTGTLGDNGTNRTRTIPCTFSPKLIIVIGKATSGNNASETIILPDLGVGTTSVMAGSLSLGSLTATKSGNNVVIEHSDYPDMQPLYCCFSGNMVYKYLCIG